LTDAYFFKYVEFLKYRNSEEFPFKFLKTISFKQKKRKSHEGTHRRKPAFAFVAFFLHKFAYGFINLAASLLKLKRR
jgi:hypothetical protein